MREHVPVSCLRLAHGADLPLPVYESEGAAGLDLMAALGPGQTQTLRPGAHVAVPTGLAIALPKGYEAQVRPRSGLARKHAVTVLNAPGTVDADYRGEIQVLLINLGTEDFIIEHGMRIAQMVVAPVTQISWNEETALSETARGSGGFGSTGLK